MAYINYNSYRLFGGAGDTSGRHGATVSSQVVGETIAVGDVGRKFHGPKMNGHFSIHGKATAAFGAGSTVTVWYSNLLDPDSDTDAHWVQDPLIVAVDLTSTASFFINVGNVYADWIRVKVHSATTQGDIYLYIRSEGEQAR